MSRQLHIAVLECDTPITPVAASRGTYGDIFCQLLESGLSHLREDGRGVTFHVSKWDVVTAQSYPTVGEVDAFLITGSKHTAYNREPWIIKLIEYVRDVLDTRTKPVAGFCFGHQIIALALGGKVEANPAGWEVSVEDVRLSQEGQRLFGVSCLHLHQMHRDIVVHLPEEYMNLGSSAKCEVQGIFKSGRVLSLQAHPEFDSQIMSAIVNTRHEQGIFDDEMFESAMLRAENKHDGVLVSAAVWRFILGTLKQKPSK